MAVKLFNILTQGVSLIHILTFVDGAELDITHRLSMESTIQLFVCLFVCFLLKEERGGIVSVLTCE